MKIIFVVTTVECGGAENQLLNLTKVLVLENQIEIIYVKGKSSLIQCFHELGIYPKPLLNLNTLIKIAKLITIKDKDQVIIQGWMYHGNVVATLLHFLIHRNSSLFWSIHHSAYAFNQKSILSSLKLRINAFLSYYANKVVYVTDIIKQEHISKGFNSINAVVISNGIDTDLFVYSNENRLFYRKEFQINDNDFVIGIIARNHPLKDYSTFFNGLSILLKSYKQLQALIIGRGIILSKFKIELDGLNAEELGRIHLLGERNDVWKVMSAIDCIVLTSLSESFPLVVLEALSVERVCVVSEAITFSNTFPNAIVTFPILDVPSYVSAIESVMQLDELERSKYGNLARQTVIERFSVHHTIDQYLHLWKSFLQDNKT